MPRFKLPACSQLLRLCSLMLVLQLCTSDRFLKSQNVNCSLIHPQCTSCTVKRSKQRNGFSYTSLLCKSCSSPKYQLYVNSTSSTCGKPVHDGSRMSVQVYERHDQTMQLLLNAYAVSVAGCAAGFYVEAASSSVCKECPKNSWCQGGAAGQQTPCGECSKCCGAKLAHTSARHPMPTTV